MNFDPRQIVVPIIGTEGKGAKIFLGTGSFCGEKRYLVTADHVIRDWHGQLGIFRFGDKHVKPATLIARSGEVDLAVLEVPDFSPEVFLSINPDARISNNRQILSYEYGTTISAGKEINFAPATRIGNVTRQMNMTDKYGLMGDSILEISFPALLGASGSPIFTNDESLELWGIVVANLSYSLLPAQIESVLNERGETEEEIQYMLPQALAVNVKHLFGLIGNL